MSVLLVESLEHVYSNFCRVYRTSEYALFEGINCARSKGWRAMVCRVKEVSCDGSFIAGEAQNRVSG